MEQTNLVVSPDGKTWDEVTRDTSYLGNVVCQMSTDATTNWSSTVIFDEWRGKYSSNTHNWFNKYFAIAYDRLICLETGVYKFIAQTTTDSSSSYFSIYKNGVQGILWHSVTTTLGLHAEQIHFCERGDYIQFKGEFGNTSLQYNNASVEKLS